MIEITHDSIKVRNEFFITLFRDVFQSFLANGKCVISAVSLVISYGKIEIKLQHIGIRLDTGLTKTDYFFIISFLYCFTEKCHAGSRIRRINVQHSFQYGHGLFIHFLGKEILGIQHRHLRIILVLLHNTVEKVDYTGTVSTCAFIFNHKLTHHVQLCIRGHLLIQQKGIQLLLVEFFLSGLFVIRSQ